MEKIAVLTSGGIAPCLSSAIASLVTKYHELLPDVEIICYKDGYKGLLLGESIAIDHETVELMSELYKFGGSPIGNSRVKLSNVKDCINKGFVKEGEDPRAVAARQLIKDQIKILYTIGGDDTSTAAADLAEYLKSNGYQLQVMGLPKTIDNDIVPIFQSLGANTAAEQTAIFFEHIVSEVTSNPKMFIVHEVMGRKCGWLTAASAQCYMNRLREREFVPRIGMTRDRYSIHGIYIPEIPLDIAREAKRLKNIMDTVGCVNIFVSEGACVDDIVREMESKGDDLPRDAFGHVKLDAVNPGKWFGEQFSQKIGAEKVLVQKSGYFARSAPSNVYDIALINDSVDEAIKRATAGESGVIGLDEENGNKMRCISFSRIKGGKAFDFSKDTEFIDLLKFIGQV